MSLASALRRVYGEAAEAQQARYRAALAAFARIYGPGPVLAFRTPGRVNLIGEHTDYNHGFVLPVALDRDVLLLARPRPDATVQLHNVEPKFAPRVFPIGPSILAASPGDWSNYVRGAAQMVAREPGTSTSPHHHTSTRGELHGIDALVAAAPPHGTPRGAGVSSSSALTVAAALALAHVNGWQPDAVPFAHLCSQAEWYVGTRGGIMDQFIALLAQPDHALFLDCRPAEDLEIGIWDLGSEQRTPDQCPRTHDQCPQYTFAHVPLPPGVRVLVADTGVHHANVRGEFNLRVAACRAGVACLRPHFTSPGRDRGRAKTSRSDREHLCSQPTTDGRGQTVGGSEPPASCWHDVRHLRDVQDVPWDELAPLLPEVMSVAEAHARGADLDDLPLATDRAAEDVALRVRACCRHVHSENARVLATVSALEAGDVEAVGRLLNEAHASARDDYAISCPELEAMVDAARAIDGTVGARLTGAGWGGCVVALVHEEAVPEFERQVTRRYREQTGRDATIFACRAGGGAELVAAIE
jgi:galactokinase